MNNFEISALTIILDNEVSDEKVSSIDSLDCPKQHEGESSFELYSVKIKPHIDLSKPPSNQVQLLIPVLNRNKRTIVL